MNTLPSDNFEGFAMPAQAASYGYRMIGCGDFNPPEYDDPTLGGEPYYRWLGARDGILAVTATARYLSDPDFRLQEVATHDGDEEVLTALHEAGMWPVNHHNCKAMGGRVQVAETMGRRNPRVERAARFILTDLESDEYKEATAAKRSLYKMGRVHTPEKVMSDYSARDSERAHLPQHEMARLYADHGLHAEGFLVNEKLGTMLRPTEIDEDGRAVRKPVYGVDAHIVGEVYHAIKGLFVIDRRAFGVSYALYSGAIAAKHIGGDGGAPLDMYRLKG